MTESLAGIVDQVMMADISEALKLRLCSAIEVLEGRTFYAHLRAVLVWLVWWERTPEAKQEEVESGLINLLQDGWIGKEIESVRTLRKSEVSSAHEVCVKSFGYLLEDFQTNLPFHISRERERALFMVLDQARRSLETALVPLGFCAAAPGMALAFCRFVCLTCEAAIVGDEEMMERLLRFLELTWVTGLIPLGVEGDRHRGFKLQLLVR